jgi:DNA polymerase-1
MGDKTLSDTVLRQTTFILDASSFWYRAYYASEQRQTYTKECVPNGGVNLFRHMIEALKRKHSPDFIVAACDCHAPTFRNRLYPLYKANRSALPPVDYTAQEPGFRAVLKEFSIPAYQMAGFEADDVIGTLCQRLETDIVIAAGDKDMAQLVEWSGRVKMLNTGTGKILDAAGVFEEYGIYPDSVADYLALIGDDSDNIPGCDGVGPAGALMLLRMFGCAEDVIKRSGEISSKRYRHAVQNNAAMILLSKKLATINCQVPLEL